MQFKDEGGLLTYEKDGANYCLGYLMDFEGHGIYDATHGRVEVDPEAAERHNKVLDEMVVKGLDEQCQVGQGENLYVSGTTIKTWLGTVLGEAVKIKSAYTFTRNGKRFIGRPKAGDEVAFFMRID